MSRRDEDPFRDFRDAYQLLVDEEDLRDARLDLAARASDTSWVADSKKLCDGCQVPDSLVACVLSCPWRDL